MKQRYGRNTLYIMARSALAVKLLVTGTIARMATMLTLEAPLLFQFGQEGVATPFIWEKRLKLENREPFVSCFHSYNVNYHIYSILAVFDKSLKQFLFNHPPFSFSGLNLFFHERKYNHNSSEGQEITHQFIWRKRLVEAIF